MNEKGRWREIDGDKKLEYQFKVERQQNQTDSGVV
jgi:hypothetical protein